MDSGTPKFLDINVNYEGVFTRPIDYQAGLTRKARVPFDNVDYESFIAWLQKFTSNMTFTLYYVVPGKPMCGGLRMLKCDKDMLAFVEHGLEGNGQISIYLDICNDDLSDFIGEDRIDDKGKEKVVEEESNNAVRDDPLSDDSLDLEDEDAHIVSKFKHTSSDIFLSKLCDPDYYECKVEDEFDAENEGADDIASSEDDEDVSRKVQRGVVYPVFDPDMDWKLMKPVLGLRFENAAQLRHCLTCYAVANGYQLCYVKSESNRTLVRCGNKKEGFVCPFRLRASWPLGPRGKECLQIRCLNEEHQCARNYSHGPLVTAAWIGKMYLRELIANPNIKIKDMQRDILDRFLVKVSAGQCFRAKSFALHELNGGLI